MEEEKIIHLTDTEYRKVIDSCIEDINKQWKDKIKAKIKELEKEGDYRTEENLNGRVHFWKEDIDYKIEVLEELLGDDNDEN